MVFEDLLHISIQKIGMASFLADIYHNGIMKINDFQIIERTLYLVKVVSLNELGDKHTENSLSYASNNIDLREIARVFGETRDRGENE